MKLEAIFTNELALACMQTCFARVTAQMQRHTPPARRTLTQCNSRSDSKLLAETDIWQVPGLYWVMQRQLGV